MYVILVTFKIKPEYRQSFLEASFEDASQSLLNETDCIRFDIFKNANDDQIIYFYEIYSNEKSFEFHKTTPHFLKWKNTIKDDWFVEPIIINQSELIFPEK